MDEKVIVAFTKWMQTKDKQLAQVPTEQLAQQVVKALQTEEGQKQLQPLFQQFQTEMQGGMFKRGGKMDQAVKKMQWGETIDYTPLVEEDGKLYDETGGVWTSASEWLRHDAGLHPEKYSPIYPKLGEPLTKPHSYVDMTAAMDGENAYRTQHPDGTITGFGGQIVERIVPQKPAIRYSGNDPITRHVVGNDTVYMMSRPTTTGYLDRRGRATDKEVSKYRNRVNTGWHWKRDLWKKAYNSGLVDTPE